MNGLPFAPISLALLFPLLLFAGACDSGGAEEKNVDNEFTFEIASASSSSIESERAAVQDTTISGFAFFFADQIPETGQGAFAIYLNDSNSFSRENASRGLFGWLTGGSERPGTGSYSLKGDASFDDPDFTGTLWEDFEGGLQGGALYAIESGTLTLDSSSEARVAGTIEATATATALSDTGTTKELVTISGSFTAEDVEVFIPLANPNP